MNKSLIIFVVLVIVVLIVYKKNNLPRPDMIDFLNVTLTHPKHVGKWVTLNDQDLRKVYKVFALIKKNIKPDQADYLEMLATLERNNIATDVF